MRMLLLRLLLAALVLGAPGFPAACGAETDALYPIRQGGLWGYMDRQGNVAIAPKWAYAQPFSGGMALVGVKPLSSTAWTLYGHADGVIDRSGHYLVTPEDGLNIEEHAFAYHLRDTAHDDTEGFLDKASGFLQMPNEDYSTTSLWDDDGTGPIAVMNSEGLTGYIDRATGKTAIPFRYTGQSEEAGFQNGYALPADEITLHDKEGESTYYGMRYHLIDREGREIDMPEGVFPFSRPRNGAFVYATMAAKGKAGADPFEKGFGLMQPGGKVLIPRDPDIPRIEPPDEYGMVCFLKETEKGALCGHMDSTGRVIVPPRYNISSETYDTYCFFHGYAVIEDLSANTRWVILDTDGREVFTAPSQREDGRAFELAGHVQKDGLLWYSTWKPEKRAYGVTAKAEQRYGLMRIKDGRAEYLTEPAFEDYEGFSLAADNIFRETAHFAEGVHPVRQNGLWGYINEQAEWVIPPAWHEAASFRDGLALVEKAGKLAYIDHSGAVVWQERD